MVCLFVLIVSQKSMSMPDWIEHRSPAARRWTYRADTPPPLTDTAVCGLLARLARARGSQTPLVDELVAAGAPVAGFLSLDLAGHGESAALPTRAGRWGDFVGSNIRSALRSAGLVDEGGDALPDLVGLGHSMGGTAVLLAQLEHAGSRPLFSRLALVEPVLFDHAAVVQRDSPKANRLYAATMMRQRTLKDREALMAYLTERRRPWASWDSRALEAYASSGFREAEGGGGALELVCKPETEAPLYLHPPAMIERLRDAASLGAPVTFLVGAESNHFDMVKGVPTPEFYRRFVAPLCRPQASVEIVAGAGHFAPQQRPARTAALVCRAFGFHEAAQRCDRSDGETLARM